MSGASRKTGSIDRLYHVKTEMEINAYHYTAGPLGTAWLEALRTGVLKAARCSKCGTRFLPPRLYCPRCFSEVSELVEIEGEGYIDTYSVIYYDDSGRRLEEPVVIAVIRFDGVYGGLIHRVKIDPREVRRGLKVRPVFRSERRGSLTDIEYFVVSEKRT